jgi:hypothetical protein
MTSPSGHWLRSWPYLALGVLAMVYLVLAYLIPPGADTLWRLHIATGMLQGKTLYRDFIEVNPPLWFWGALPAAQLGGYSALVVLNLVMMFGALYAFGALGALTLSKAGGRAAMVGLGLGLFLLNVAEVGQREQAFLVACTLWCAIISARVEGKAIPRGLVIVATCLCAYGFALKHYFVLVPVICELALIANLKRRWRPLRLETLTLGGLAIAYAIAVLTLTPDFLGRVLVLVQASYDGFGPGSLVRPAELHSRIIKLTAFALSPIFALWLTRDKSPLLRLLTLACLAAVAIIMVQEKYWRYHLIAANGLAIVIVFVAWYRTMTGESKGWRVVIAKGALPLCLAGLLWLGSVQPSLSNLRTHGQPIVATLRALVAAEPRANHIVILSTAPDNAFYPLAAAGRAHWSRHYSMWMMPGLYLIDNKAPDAASKQRERARVLGEFVEDIMCTPPNLIIGEVGLFRDQQRTRFDAMAFLSEDKVFSVWLDRYYAQQPSAGRYPVWRLKAAKPKVASNCL